MDRDFNLLTVEDYLNINEIAVKENISFSDAMEIYSKKFPGKIRNLGVLHEDGTLVQTEITNEGVETKEVNLTDELERTWTEMLEERDSLDNDE